MMSKILDLRSKRNARWAQTKAFLAKNRGENGLVAPEAVEQYNKTAQEVKDLGAEIVRLEQQAQLEELQSGMLSAFSLEGEAIFRRSLELGLRLGAGGQAATPSAAGSRRR